MKNNQFAIYGIGLSIVIYFISIQFGTLLKPNINFFTNSFGTHTLMIFLSILFIVLFKKQVNYKISLPKFKKAIIVFFTGALVMIIMGIITQIVLNILGVKSGIHPIFKTANTLQIFVFVFIYASISEEFLFRGFLLNILKPLQKYALTILNIKITLSVIISAVLFGLAHLILLRVDVSLAFALRTVLSTAVLGLFAGYFHEKYNNHSYAILVHMGANLLGVLASIAMTH